MPEARPRPAPRSLEASAPGRSGQSRSRIAVRAGSGDSSFGSSVFRELGCPGGPRIPRVARLRGLGAGTPAAGTSPEIVWTQTCPWTHCWSGHDPDQRIEVCRLSYRKINCMPTS